MLKVSIFGSCVSRDAFEFSIGTKFEVEKYIARSSFARYALEPVNIDLDLSDIKSVFQRNMVENDLKLNDLDEFFIRDSDIYLVDFIDERFGLIEIGNTYVTDSSELNLALEKNNIRKDNIVEKFSEEHFNLLIKGFDIFYKFAEKYGKEKKIFINKVYWSNLKDDGTKLFRDDSFIIKTNNFLDKIYDVFKLKYSFANFIDYNQELLLCNSVHKWGVTPYHFIDKLYYCTLNYLSEHAMKSQRKVKFNMNNQSSSNYSVRNQFQSEKLYRVENELILKYLEHFNPILTEVPSLYAIYQEAKNAFLANDLDLAKKLYNLNLLIRGSSIPYQCTIGKNSVFAYGGLGVNIHSSAIIGERCTIGSQVTIGGDLGAPIIGNDVYISTGAKILGNVKIGTGAIIEPNAVVLNHVEPFTIMSGVPAKEVGKITKENFEDYKNFYWSKISSESAKAFIDYYFK